MPLENNKPQWYHNHALKEHSNIIWLKGKYLPIEVKLNIKVESDIVGQVTKYCKLSKCYLTNGTPEYIDSSIMYSKNVVIIDTNKIFIYDDEKKSKEEI